MYVHAFLENESCIVALQRDADGRRRRSRIPAEWVAYLEKDAIDPETHRELRATKYVRSLTTQGSWVRLGFAGRQYRDALCFDERSPLLQRGLVPYEGDVHPVVRWVTDNNVQVAAPRRVYLDLEADSRVPFSRKEEMRILSWALVDDLGNAQSGVLEEDTDASERVLLQALWNALQEFDQVVAWSGDRFDFPLLFERTFRRGIQVEVREWLWLDHLAVFERMNKNASESGEEKQSLALNAIAFALLGEGKEETPPEVAARWGNKGLGALAWELWEAGGHFRELLVKYNVRDTDLCRRIEDETGYVRLFQTLCESCHVFPESESLNPTRQVDGFMLRLGFERDFHFRSKRYSQIVEQFEGAYVMEPKYRGIVNNVHVGDFASLYPSIILTWNMSPETKRAIPVNGPIPEGHCRAPQTRQGFTTAVKGILPTAVAELIRLRKEWSDRVAKATPGTPEAQDAQRKSMSYKVAANSFFGVVGSPFSRYYDRMVAESITTCGQWLIQQTMHAAEERQFFVGYGDTDSLFVSNCSREQFGDFVKWCNADLYPNKLRELGCVENHIKLAYEKEFAVLVMTTAKRYIGRFAHYKGTEAAKDSKPEIKGLEYKRGDASKAARLLQGKVIDLLMGGGLKLLGITEASTQVEDFHEILSKERHHVLTEELPLEEVQQSKALSKAVDQYGKQKADGKMGSVPAHVRVAAVLQKRGWDVSEGTRIEYVVTDGKASPQAVIPACDYTGKEVDRYHVWESMVFPPSLRLLQAAFPDHNWDDWAKVRPAKSRKRGKAVHESQQALPDLPTVTVSNRIASPYEELMLPSYIERRILMQVREYVVKVDEEKLRSHVPELKQICELYPGVRPLVLVLRMKDGTEATMTTRFLVDGSLDLYSALADYRLVA